jgi:outer membrane protein assembly factor BamB
MMSALAGVFRAMAVLATLCASACQASPRTISPKDPASPLRIERMIALPDVTGRIDHLAIDLRDKLLFVAEYGNGTVDAVDLAAGNVAGRITGLREPQGIAVLSDGQVVVACGDGSVHFYAAADRHEIATLSLGDDADNVRVDSRNGHVVVGYGAGALAVIDPATHRIIAKLMLSGHPEGFRLIGGKVLVNIPDRGTIVAADIDTGKVTASWSTGARRLNFPLAVDTNGKWFALAYRFPAALQVRDTARGDVLSTRPACGDADDLFIDRDRFLLVCGAGHVDVLSAIDPNREPVRVETAAGARTGLFVPELRTLFVAAPARGGAPAALWVLRAG